MKRALALCLAALMALGAMFAFSMTPQAATDLMFVVINDVFVRNLTSATMPIRMSGTVYMPYSILRRLMTLKLYYNEEMQQLKVYNSTYIMTFDLANGITYDESGNIYPLKAIRRNGTIFVPVSTICNKFGYSYSYITKSLLGPIIRINSEEPTMSDEMLPEYGADSMLQIYKDYAKQVEEEEKPSDPNPPSVNPSVPDPEPEEPEEPEAPERKLAYLSLEGEIGPSTGEILDVLDQYNTRATFFVTAESALAYPALLRRIFVGGHSVGICLPGKYDSASQLTVALDQANEALKSVLQYKTRLLCLEEGSKMLTDELRETVIEQGYRLWDSNIDPKAASSKADTVYANTLRLLGNSSRTGVIRLRNNQATAQALPNILTGLRGQNASLLTISEWDTPINAVQELR